MATNRTLLKAARLLHLYSGVFIAPALLFFAFTGGVQTFSLHETTRGSSYKPPAILVELAQLHKKQTIVIPVRKPPANEARPGSPPGESGDHSPGNRPDQRERKPNHAPDTSASPGAPQPTAPVPAASASTQPPSTPATPAKVHNLLPMKIFFLIVAIGLFFSTLTGLYMAYKYARRKRTITLTLLAGVAIPLLLLLF